MGGGGVQVSISRHRLRMTCRERHAHHAVMHMSHQAVKTAFPPIILEQYVCNYVIL
jgi:hypothetical protein